MKPWITPLLLLAVTACEPRAATPDGGASESPSPTFTETLVTVHADGTRDVETRDITADEERERNAAYAHAGRTVALSTIVPLGPDDKCTADTFELYDQPDQTGNLICFRYAGTGPATISLWNVNPDPECTSGPPAQGQVPDARTRGVPRCTWAIPAGSYRSGDTAGMLLALAPDYLPFVVKYFGTAATGNFAVDPNDAPYGVSVLALGVTGLP